jgi:two-component sensor histidine kinase
MTKPIRVLLIDDDEDEFHLTRQLLDEVEGQRFSLDWVSRYEQGLEAIGRNAHDVYLLDYRLGARTGLELLREAIARGAQAPFILLTGKGDREVDLEAMRAGAADYVVKGWNSALMERSIRYAIERKRAEDALRAAHNELEKRVAERTAELASANQVLQEEIDQRQRAEEQLRVLLREIHHRVKNNLQVIASLIDLQSDYVQDSRSLEMFREIRNRVKSMARVHEMLYQSRNLARIYFADYVPSLVGDVLRSFGVGAERAERVSSRIEVDPDLVLDVEQAIPCGLILNELVSNAIKHGFAGGRRGEIAVSMHAAGGYCRLTVQDNGVGLPLGFDLAQNASLGLQLVLTLTQQLDGTLDGASSGGTTFQLTFPHSDSPAEAATAEAPVVAAPQSTRPHTLR